MLLWLQKNPTPELRNFKAKIFLLTLSFHLILLFYGLFINFTNVIKIEIKKGQYTIPLVFLPLQKTVVGSLYSIKNSSLANTSNVQIKLADSSKININKTQSSLKISAQNHKAPALKKTKIFLDKKTKQQLIKEQNLKKINAQKQQKEIEKIKLMERRQEKELKEKSQILKKELESKQVDQILKNEISNSKTESIVHKNINEGAQEKITQEVEQQEIYIGRNDLEQLHMEDQVRREIGLNWKPPVGLPKNLSCTIKVIVANDGKLQVQIIKSSKSIAFDLSIKRDISKVVLPKELWGKEVILNYTGQD